MKRILAALAGLLISCSALAVTVSDDFNRANGAIGANYTLAVGSAANLAIVSNALEGDNAASVVYIRSAETFADNQEAFITAVGPLSSGNQYAEVLVRASGSGGTFQAYTCYTDGASGSGHTEIGRYNSGSITVLKANAVTFADGDEIGCRATGSTTVTIELLKNDSVVDSITDSSGSRIASGGKLGIGVYANAAFVMDNFNGGDVGGGGGGGGGQPVRTMHQFRLRRD